MANILDRITESRRSVTEVAEAAGLSRYTLYKIDTGETDPHLSTVVKLAKALGVKPQVLFPELGE